MNNENSSQTNPFLAIMAKKTDDELAKILSVDRGQFTEEALSAAQYEYDKRGLKDELISKEIEIQKTEGENILKTNEVLATKGQRFVHLLIDLIVIYGVMIVTGIIAVMLGAEFESDPILDRLIGAVYVVAYYLVFESQLNTTPGKMITKCVVVMENGDEPSFEAIVKRSLCRLIPFEPFSFLGQGSGWHDIISKTKVIRKI